MAAEIVPTTTGVVIKMQAPQAPHTVSSQTIAPSGTTTSSTKMSMTTSTSSSKTTTTKITKKTSTTTTMRTSSSSSTTVTQGGTTTTSYKTIKTQSSTGSFSDNLASVMGISADSEMEKLKSIMDQQMSRMRSETFSLKAIEGSESTQPETVHFDAKSIMDYADNDNLRFNFDMSNFASETVNVKTVGNKIEVQAQRKTKTAEGETCEEYSRTYEMPTQEELHPDKVTSSLFKEGVLTVQLPVSEAMQGVDGAK